jgi:ferredoxin-NADP reductase
MFVVLKCTVGKGKRLRACLLCGPEKMVKDINEQLQQLGAKTDSLVFEK